MTIKPATFYTVVVMAYPKVLMQPSYMYGDQPLNTPKCPAVLLRSVLGSFLL